MEEDFESARNAEATQMMLQRRRNIAEEQAREVAARERGTMKVAFRKSDEEERLIALLSKQIEE